ncbi:MAG: HAD family hydrolase [Flavitalea sp.]
MSRPIAFFDFDGTVTTKDSLLEFIKYCKGNTSFYWGFLLHAPVLIAYRLKIISNQRAKEIMLSYFFKKMTVEEFNGRCDAFLKEVMPTLIRPKAMKEIQKLQEAGAEIAVVSASPENWVAKWCEQMKLTCIATRLIVKENKITGSISGKNCYGTEKVRRINEAYDLSSYSVIYCYGDTAGDRPMLSLGKHAFYKPFR